MGLPTVCAIAESESGRRQPSVHTLAALIAATGFELDLQLRATPQRLDALTGPIGSVVRREDHPDSDLDLRVDLPTDIGLIGLGRIRDQLKSIVGCRVDLVPATDLKTGVRENVEAELIVL